MKDLKEDNMKKWKKVQIRIYFSENENDATICTIPFHWKKLGKNYRSFEPVKNWKYALNRYYKWESLDIDKPTDSLENWR